MSELLTSELESKNRYVMFPIIYNDIWKMYKQAVSAFWVVEEISFSQDIDDWIKLNSNEQHFVKHILAFFSFSDGIVMDNLAARFLQEVSVPEVKAFYSFQIAMEAIHSEAYSLMIDTYIKDNNEKHMLFNAMTEIPCLQEKAQWALKYINDTSSSFAQRLVAFAIVEGIFFSGAFCSIFWLKERGLMPGLCMSNEFISRDEGLHTEFAILLYTTMITHKLHDEQVYDMIKDAVQIEDKFINESIPCSMLGMNSLLMKEYIHYVADRLLVQLGYDKIYNVANPFDFMQRISLNNKSNFFEYKPTEYAKANVGKTNIFEFSTNEDF